MFINRILFLTLSGPALLVGLVVGIVFFGCRSGFRMGIDFMLWLGK